MEIFVKICENYGSIFWEPFGSQCLSAFFSNIHLPDLRASRFKIAAIIRFVLDVLENTRWLLYNCSSANEMKYKVINKKGDRPTFICNNFHAEKA